MWWPIHHWEHKLNGSYPVPLVPFMPDKSGQVSGLYDLLALLHLNGLHSSSLPQESAHGGLPLQAHIAESLAMRLPGCQAAEARISQRLRWEKKNAAVNPNVTISIISQPKRMIHRYSEYILPISIIIPGSVLKLMIDHQGLLFTRPWTHRP